MNWEVSNPSPSMEYTAQPKSLQRNDVQAEADLTVRIDRSVRAYIGSAAFNARKVGDTPTDALSLVPRKFVTNNGLLASRPASSVATVGQPYFATDTGIPMIYSVEGWRNGVGSIVALNN